MMTRTCDIDSVFAAIHPHYDLFFIGGGLSSTLTLIQVLRELESMPTANDPPLHDCRWRIAVADTWGNFGGGLPYGRSVNPMLLLNNDVANMDVLGFHHWLKINRDLWLGMLSAHPSPAVAKWLRFNRDVLAISQSQPENYLSLFLPRCVFGMFISDILGDALTRARGLSASVELIREEVVSLERIESGFCLKLAGGQSLGAALVVLGLGSLPPDPAPGLERTCGYIHDTNSANGAPLRSMVKVLAPCAGKPGCVVIIGSHASAMETIYTIAHDERISQLISELVVISPSGRLPEAIPSGTAARFEPQSVNRLLGRREVPAEEVIAAALSDVAEARVAGYSVIDYSPSLCSAFGRVFASLSAKEKRRFVEKYGMQFTALNRHTPPEYAAAARGMLQEGKLRLIAAEVTAVEPPNGAMRCFAVTFKAASGSSGQLSAEVVINCRGAGPLSRTSSLLLRDLLHSDSGIARPNRCGHGIAVSGDFEASPGLFVAGPLLAGHSHGADHLWNLERAERIDWLARRMAPTIATRLASHGQSKS
jgi:uncharacterized NAD(P)/FAD-binding protein YdhS